MRIQDITGRRFGRWTVVKFQDKVIYQYATGGCTVLRWLCRCDCGKSKVVTGQSLKSGKSISCGCYQSESLKTRFTTHGMTGTPEYAAWAHMMDRCLNPKNGEYSNYGARGITVCERWKVAANFLADIGLRPSPKHSLERVDNGLGYSPENCIWATTIQQGNNKRVNRRLRFKGKVQTIAQWSAAVGISASNIWNRLADGWTTEQALTIPVSAGRAGWESRRARASG